MLRVATLNLLHDTDALAERVEHLITELITEDLDFLLLQEVLPESGAGFDVVGHLSRSLGMPHTYLVVGQRHRSGNAIISRHPLTRVSLGVTGGRDSAFAETTVDGRAVVVVSHHGFWGSRGASERLEELQLIDKYAASRFTRGGAHLDRDTRPIVILGGDLNAVPSSASVRYLTGLDAHNGHSTLWVDAADHAGDTGHTSGDPTALAIATASGRPGSPYRPERTPRRRIDYLFVYEWCYGQAGEPVSARRFAMDPFTASDGRTLTVSDHYGVLAELWTPALDAAATLTPAHAAADVRRLHPDAVAV